MSHWVHSAQSSEQLPADAARAVAAALQPPGQVATLILPADVSWEECTGGPAAMPAVPAARRVREDVIGQCAAALACGEPALILLGGHVSEQDLELAGESPRRAARASGWRPSPLGCPGAQAAPPARRFPTFPSSRSRTSRPCAAWCWSAPRSLPRSSPTRTCPAGWRTRNASCSRWPNRTTTASMRCSAWPRPWMRRRSNRRATRSHCPRSPQCRRAVHGCRRRHHRGAAAGTGHPRR
jgi:hypothetical protein